MRCSGGKDCLSKIKPQDTVAGIDATSAIRNGHHHKIKSIKRMHVEKLTGKQRFHQRPVMGKGTYVQGTK